jgi:hypothetical protein
MLHRYKTIAAFSTQSEKLAGGGDFEEDSALAIRG